MGHLNTKKIIRETSNNWGQLGRQGPTHNETGRDAEKEEVTP